MPLRVAMTRNLPALKSDSVMVAIGTSPGSTCTPGRLMIAIPLACRLASTMVWTLAEKTRPRW